MNLFQKKLEYKGLSYFHQTRCKWDQAEIIACNRGMAYPTLPRVHVQFFSSWIINTWNKLFEKTITAESMGIFKQRMDAEWSSRDFKLDWEAMDQHSVPGH